MKRAVSLVLLIVSFLLVGCSNIGTVTSLSYTKEEAAVSVVVPEGVTPAILVEDENLIIKATGLVSDGVWGLGLSIYLENKTGDDVEFNLAGASINGIGINPHYTQDVSAHSKLNSMIEWDTDILELTEINNITDIGLHWRVSASFQEEYLLDSSYHFYPYGEENKTISEITPLEGRGYLFDNINASLLPARFYYDAGLGEYVMGFFMTNKTYKDLSFEFSEIAFDDTACGMEIAIEVPTKSTSYEEIVFEEDSLKNLGINYKSPGTISFFLRVHDVEGSWKWNIHNSTLSVNPF